MVEPSPIPSNVPTLPRPGPAVSAVSSATTTSASTIVDGVRIKSEPNTTYDLTNITQGNGLPVYNGQAAAQRAAQQLQQRFGAQANPQINQLQQQAAAMGAAGQHLQSRPVQQGSRTPTPMSEQQKQQYADHQRYAQEQQRLQIIQAQRANINNAQTDGAGDWNTLVTERRAATKQALAGVRDADLTFMQQLQQSRNAMEGGGLLLPLSQQPILSTNPKKHKTAASAQPSDSHSQMAAAPRSYPLAVFQPIESTPFNLESSQSACVAGSVVEAGLDRNPLKVPQFDGGDDSDEDNKTGIKDDPDVDDEDAINSDLDDTDEENRVEQNEESGTDGRSGELMVCTYDKVQRVKNKWKCTLKDGILTTGGKE